MKKKVTIKFIIALLFSIAFPCGIALLISNSSSSAGIGIGSVLIVLGFYGSPFAWIAFGNIKTKYNLCKLVIDENIQDVEEMAKLKNEKPETTLKHLKALINSRYLQGYKIVDDKYIVKNDSKTLTQQELLRLNKKVDVLECSGCGAPVETFEGEKTICPYCGRPVKK